MFGTKQPETTITGFPLTSTTFLGDIRNAAVLVVSQSGQTFPVYVLIPSGTLLLALCSQHSRSVVCRLTVFSLIRPAAVCTPPAS